MLADVVKTLDDIGWPVIDVKLPALAPMVAAFGKMRAVETAIAHADTYPARADEYGPIMRAMIDAGHRLAAVEYQTLTERRLEFTRSLRRVFHDVDILLMPSAGIASPTLETMRGLGQDPELTARLAMPTAPFNVSGNPAICLPAGTTRAERRSASSSSAVNSTSTCSSEPATHFSKSPGIIADARRCEKPSAAKGLRMSHRRSRRIALLVCLRTQSVAIKGGRVEH